MGIDKKPGNVLTRFFMALGPGLITGAADDDPSGVATYTVAGAQLGTSLLWTALVTWPLMAAVQMMCARIGMVTGHGLARALGRKFPKPLVILASSALLAANTINIGADLAGMGDAARLLTGISARIWIAVFGVGITYATVRFRYQQIAAILKWLAAVLLVYVVAAFTLHPRWFSILGDTIVPSWPKTHDAWATLVAILGTTISPYLFFWQSSQEVEEKKAAGRRRLIVRPRGPGEEAILDRKLDVGAGTFFSNIVMYFIILTAALTLYKAGAKIETTTEAVEALRPLAGNFAAALYTAGIIGAGLLAIPTLAGSAAYAFAEIFHWRQGLDRPFNSATAFYSLLILSTLAGIGLNFANVNPVKALFWTAVINGLLAPFLLVGILIIACDRDVMGKNPSSMLGRVVVGLATLLMFGAAVGMFVF